MVIRSPRGQTIGKLIETIKQLPSERPRSLVSLITGALHCCLQAGKRHKLPSVAQGVVWSAFHKMRTRKDILCAWNSFLEANALQTSSCHELALQVILDEMLKQLLAKQSAAVDMAPEVFVRPLTLCESNGVRYMAGYIPAKLLKKYRRGSKNSSLDIKYKLFVKTLQHMKAHEQPGDPDSPYEYSKLWMEVIDRGGLYHIRDDVFCLFESIEVVVRQHFNFPSMKSYVPDDSLGKLVYNKVLNSNTIVTCWENIAFDIPSKYEKYSVELLGIITKLWITVRGHSFTKGWNAMFERKYKQGTRKTLANK